MTKPSHTAFVIRERTETTKPFWLAIGSAWTNRDGSFNITLDATPLDGKLVLRVRKDKEPAEAAGPQD